MTTHGVGLKSILRRVDFQFEEFKRILIDLARIPSVSAQGFPRAKVGRSATAWWTWRCVAWSDRSTAGSAEEQSLIPSRSCPDSSQT